MPEKNRNKPDRPWHHIREKPRVAAVYFILRAFVLLTLVAQILHRSYENAALCVLTLGLFLLPSVFERRLHLELPDTLEIIVYLFIFAAEILGEINAFYISFPYWDAMLHTMNGFLCAAIGFALVDILNREKTVSLSLSPFFMAVTAFCFSMTVGVLWEFFEFAMDQLWLLDMQKDTIVNTIATVNLDPNNGTTPVVIGGIRDVILVLEDGAQVPLGLGGYLDIGIADTMKDLLVNFMGALIFSFVGYFYVKGRGKGFFARRFIPKVLQRPPSEPEIQEIPSTDAPEDDGRAARE